MIKRALQHLQNHEASIAGVVLNDKTGKGAKYYGGYSYYSNKYYNGYSRRGELEPVLPLPKRVIKKVWGFING
jgi:Mrp family chromosome partitioning ATPase